jgi:hypothetical protein
MDNDEPPRPHAVPTLHRATAIDSIDDLRVVLFAPDENAEEFDAAVRRWREGSDGV